VDELRAISTFMRAAELGSFNKVAEAQGTTPQAVSKTIRQFEQHLGVRLFHRTTRNSRLTEEGQRLLESIRPSLEGVVGALARARSAARDDEGVVRIAASASMGPQDADAAAGRVSANAIPLIQIDLLQEDGFSDLVGDRIDVGFRGGNAPDAQVVSRRLFTVQQIVCASPAYLATARTAYAGGAAGAPLHRLPPARQRPPDGVGIRGRSAASCSIRCSRSC
jgi:DNA-binding transcriptional LysR family regulator